MNFGGKRAIRGLAACAVGLVAMNVPAWAQSTDEPGKSDFSYALGFGGERTPAWVGASRSRYDPLPYIAFDWRDIVDLSTTDGLSVDLIHGKSWHGGLIGTMRWGRSAQNMRELADAVPTLSNTLQAGAYVEYALLPSLTFGANLSHDVQSTGSAYGNLYAEWDIPWLAPLEHSIKLNQELMNRSAMRRYFGLSTQSAAQLGTRAYQPGAGSSGTTLSYEAFVPTSRHTGFALGLYWTRLAQKASDSPLIADFGSRTQRTYFLAFAWHN